jgi:uracil-DNA glycosylase
VTRPRSTNAALQGLLREVRACTICAAHLPLPPRPVLQAGAAARILIAGQAPGRKVAASGVPFDDASGDRLRAWMGIDKAAFHDPDFIAIRPMGFCYPGTGASGDLPPRPECAATWRERLLEQLPSIELTLVIGTYAQAWHLKPAGGGASLTATVAAWREHGARVLPLPHPSPRNNGWLQRNPWFEADVLPELKTRVRALQGR